MKLVKAPFVSANDSHNHGWLFSLLVINNDNELCFDPPPITVFRKTNCFCIVYLL